MLVGCSAAPKGRVLGGKASPAAATSLPGPVEMPRVAVAAEPEDVLSEAAPMTPVDPSLLHSCESRREIVIFKAERRLELHCGDAVAGRYAVSLGFSPEAHKEREGDGRTPEGEYFIVHKFVSQYHRSLQLAYPNVRDAAWGLERGIISRREHDAIVRAVRSCRQPPQSTMLGSHIQIHGAGGGEWAGDWTLGCVALDDDPIEAVYAFHEPGCDAEGRPRTVVRILP
jgi:murein L,D-transpeptidase YafK